MTLTRQQLDRLQCGNPECNGDQCTLVFRSGCHFETATWAFYHKETGALTIRCAECDREIVSVSVAAFHPS